jgi:hypothetical protein
MAAVLETRLCHAQTEKLTPIDLVPTLVSDELLRRQDRLVDDRRLEVIEDNASDGAAVPFKRATMTP